MKSSIQISESRFDRSGGGCQPTRTPPRAAPRSSARENKATNDQPNPTVSMHINTSVHLECALRWPNALVCTDRGSWFCSPALRRPSWARAGKKTDDQRVVTSNSNAFESCECVQVQQAAGHQTIRKHHANKCGRFQPSKSRRAPEPQRAYTTPQVRQGSFVRRQRQPSSEIIHPGPDSPNDHYTLRSRTIKPQPTIVGFAWWEAGGGRNRPPRTIETWRESLGFRWFVGG